MAGTAARKSQGTNATPRAVGKLAMCPLLQTMDPDVSSKHRGNLGVVKTLRCDAVRRGTPFHAVGDDVVPLLHQVAVLWILFPVFAIQPTKLRDIAEIHSGVHRPDHVVLFINPFVCRRDGVRVKELGAGIVDGAWPSNPNAIIGHLVCH